MHKTASWLILWLVSRQIWSCSIWCNNHSLQKGAHPSPMVTYPQWPQICACLSLWHFHLLCRWNHPSCLPSILCIHGWLPWKVSFLYTIFGIWADTRVEHSWPVFVPLASVPAQGVWSKRSTFTDLGLFLMRKGVQFSGIVMEDTRLLLRMQGGSSMTWGMWWTQRQLTRFWGQNHLPPHV